MRSRLPAVVGWVLLSAVVARGAPTPDDGRPPGGAAGELFAIAPTHSQIEFAVPFMGLTQVRGTFEDWGGALWFDPRGLGASTVTLVIEAASLHTGNASRDRHLRSSDFLDVEKFPRIVFVSRTVPAAGKGKWVVHGDLTLHGVTQPVEIPFTVRHPPIRDREGVDYLGFDAAMTLNWRSFGIQATNANNSWFQPAKMLVNDSLEATFSIEADRRHPAQLHYPALDAVRSEVASAGLPAYLTHLAALRAQDAGAAVRLTRPLTDLGRGWYESGRAADAVTLLEAVSEAAPKDTAVRVELAQAYLASGNNERAVAALRQVLALDPEDPEARELLRHHTP
jgi:polyisoprenoid-binding protein YceI